MKITGFRPLIVTKDPASAIKVFEELGFEKRHTKTEVEGGKNVAVVMKDANGNYVNITKAADQPQDLTMVSISVDNFQEAYDFFIGKGFIDPRGGKVTDTKTSLATMLVAPSGCLISISEHIK